MIVVRSEDAVFFSSFFYCYSTSRRLRDKNKKKKKKKKCFFLSNYILLHEISKVIIMLNVNFLVNDVNQKEEKDAQTSKSLSVKKKVK